MRDTDRTPSEGAVSDKLDSGLNGLGREHSEGYGCVAEIQRARMLAAMVEEVARRGVGSVTVAHVVGRSGVSRRTFYEQFADREQCFLAAFDEALARVAAVVVPAYQHGGSVQGARGWRVGIRGALGALLEFIECDPACARLLIVESLGAGPVALQRRGRVLSQIVTIIEEGRTEKAGGDQSPLTAEGIVGGVLSVIHARLCEQSSDRSLSMVELLGPLMGMIVLPYLGPAAARKEMQQRPVPKRQTPSPVARRDPLRDLEMRLTYRTIRVLMAVAAHPGSSNRVVGDGAGIGDQGQISKLLTRLHGLGLIDNAGAEPAPGEPNAWTLTAKGWEVHSTIAQQTRQN